MDRERERKIVTEARKQGKSDDFIKAAVIRDRERRSTQATPSFASLQDKSITAPKAEPEGTKGLLGGVKGFAKKGGQLLTGTGSLLNTLGQGVMSVPAGLIPGGKTFGEQFKDVRKTTGIESLEKETEAGQKLQEALTPRGTAEKVGGFIGDVATFAAPGGAIVRGGQIASKAAQATNLGSKIKGAGLASRVGTEAAGFGGVASLQQGEINKEAVTTGALAGAFPLAGALGRGVKGLVSKSTLGSGAANVLKQFKENPFVKQAIDQKMTATTVANDLVDKFKKISTVGKNKQQVGRRTILTNKEVIPSNSVVLSANKAIREALDLPKGVGVSKDVLVNKALSDQEARKVMSVLTDINRKAGKPVSKISTQRLDEIIRKLDELKSFDKTDDGSKVISAIRRSLNKKLPTRFTSLKEKSSQSISKLEDDVRGILGMPSSKLLKGDLTNADQVSSKISTLVNSFGDDIQKKGNTLKKLKEFDKLNGTDFEKRIEALFAAKEFAKKEGASSLQKLGVAGAAGLVTTGVTAFSSGGPSLGDYLAGIGAAGLTVVLRNPKTREAAIDWMLNTPKEAKEEVFKVAPFLKGTLKASLLTLPN